MTSPETPRTLFESTFLRLIRNGCWEYVQRTNSKAAVMVIPLTNEGRVVFVEQFRIPLQSPTIEFPAGMVGDEPGAEQEDMIEAAKRELLEETGYVANRIHSVLVCASLAGMTDEMMTFYLATDLQKQHDGGGVGNEQIVVHEVPLADVDAWLTSRAAAGCILDSKVHTGLYLLRCELDRQSRIARA